MPDAHPQYDIRTVADMLQLPTDAVDRFIPDLRAYLLTAHGIRDALALAMQSAVPGSTVEQACKAVELVPGFTWVDDGAQNIHARITEGDSEAIVPIYADPNTHAS